MFTIKSPLVALLAVASFATAQNSTSQLDPQSVDLTTKSKLLCPLPSFSLQAQALLYF